VDDTQVVNGKYDKTSRGHIRVKVLAIESMFLSSSMGSRVTGGIVGSITLGTIMGCNGDIDENRDAGVDACDGNIRATNRKGSVTTSAMDAAKRQSLGEKVPYKRFTTVDDVSSGSTVCLKLAEEVVLQGGVGGVAYHVLSRWSGQTRE
jgi:hypothetical protein